MKVTCNVIKDILPLYVENMVSDDTKNLVEQHICDCSICADSLHTAESRPKVPVDRDIQPLKNVEKQIKEFQVDLEELRKKESEQTSIVSETEVEAEKILQRIIMESGKSEICRVD